MKKNFFFSLLAFLFIFSSIELTSRIFISILTKDHKIFKYGFNQNIDLQVRKLSTFDFEIIDNQILTNSKLKYNYPTNDKKIIWAFGGSTSDIACRKQNRSSWPNELDDEKLMVKNYAKSGTNSDFALNSLVSAINKGERADTILWANYVNETDVIAFGFKRNPELSQKIDQKLYLNKTLYFIKSLSKSIRNYSVSFLLIEDFYLRIIHRLNLSRMIYDINKVLTPNDIRISAHNYYINTVKAINLAKEINAKFYIVTLFAKSDLMEEEGFLLKDKFFFKTISEIVDEHKTEVSWINLKEYKFKKNQDFDMMFCDNIHFTNRGNKIVSKIIKKELNLED